MAAASNQDRTPIDDSFSILKAVGEASAVFVALTFVAGWTYLATYYKTFGLNPVELEIPVAVVAVVALHALYDSFWQLLAVVVLAILAGVYSIRPRRGQRRIVVVILILLMFLSAVAAFFRGRQVAKVDVLEESASLPLVAFSSKSDAAELATPDQPSCVGFRSFGSMDCKLLLHSKGFYYFFRPIPKTLAGRIDKLDLFIIPDSDVLGVHIQRGIDLGQSQR